MGLTGFNRQRKRALSEEFGINERVADKLLAYGYATLEAVKKAKSIDLHFLSEDEIKALKGKKAAAEAESSDSDEKGNPTPEPEKPVSEEEETNTDNSDEISYPEGIDDEKAKEAYSELLPQADVEFPHHWYSGHYFLSNGSVVKGKKAAAEAEEKLGG
ncbi:MAG: hypothetical protein CL666_08655 [Balneola sp.]|nr:hypothetical protein [Balneola sp.]|tara:strand:+ start:19641 stop:20117 length:477 start_codon:yes stop_codon:yes gene_type:complete